MKFCANTFTFKILYIHRSNYAISLKQRSHFSCTEILIKTIQILRFQSGKMKIEKKQEINLLHMYL